MAVKSSTSKNRDSLIDKLGQFSANNLNTNEDIADKAAKLVDYAQALRGQELQLIEKARKLHEKEIQLKLYRKNILLAIKEQLSENASYEENCQILEKYRDILLFVAEDIQEDIDEIMG